MIRGKESFSGARITPGLFTLFQALVLLPGATFSQVSAQNAPAASPAKEQALGRQFAADIERRQPLLNDPGVDSYLQRLANRLQNDSGGEIRIYAKANAEDTPRAIALPGGYLFLSAGLIDRVQSEAELAAIMAHEIVHIIARHGTRPAQKNESGAIVALVFLGGWNGICSRFSGPDRYPKSYRSFSAKFEIEADEFGREVLTQAGFDPDALTTAFTRRAHGDEAGGDRAQQAPAAVSSTAFEAIKQKLRTRTPLLRGQGPTLRPIPN